MNKDRLDQTLVRLRLVSTRSQAESYIRMGCVSVDGSVIKKPGHFVKRTAVIQLKPTQLYVSRAGHKLESVAQQLNLDFRGKTVLDVGSSTGGFTDYALQHGAAKVIAVDVGTDQLHPSLRNDSRIELHEKTDIRNVITSSSRNKQSDDVVIDSPDIVLIDVSFISLREILPHLSLLVKPQSLIVAMVKPQFEAGKEQVHKGVIKNEHVRRDILKSFESWVKSYYVIRDKADSDVAGEKGNRERFYVLQGVIK